MPDADSVRLRELAREVENMRLRWRDGLGESHVRTGKPLTFPSALLSALAVLEDNLQAVAKLLEAAAHVDGSDDAEG
jgi:hypothetical protein